MALSYGTTGIKQKSWRVYIAASDTAGLDDIFDSLITNPATDVIDEIMDDMSELGECRDDSISVTGEDGESIAGNIVGNITINKACSMTAELINFTQDNIDTLDVLDGTSVSVMLVERDSHQVGSDDYKTAIIIRSKNLSYSENITGGDTGRGTITLSGTPRKITGFRTILDCEVV
jgi:hypothetical protein